MLRWQLPGKMSRVQNGLDRDKAGCWKTEQSRNQTGKSPICEVQAATGEFGSAVCTGIEREEMAFMEMVKIVLLCIVSAVVYGILHDQVTARACVEYFTIGHPPVFKTDSPTLLALGWGVIATWWVGLLLGIPAALCQGLVRGRSTMQPA